MAMVSIHSRLKAAGVDVGDGVDGGVVSIHSRLKAAGEGFFDCSVCAFVSIHSRLKAAGRWFVCLWVRQNCFNTQPPEGGWFRLIVSPTSLAGFQYTAA